MQAKTDGTHSLAGTMHSYRITEFSRLVGEHGLSGLTFVPQNIRLEVFVRSDSKIRPVMMFSWVEFEAMMGAGFMEWTSMDKATPTRKMEDEMGHLTTLARLMEL